MVMNRCAAYSGLALLIGLLVTITTGSQVLAAPTDVSVGKLPPATPAVVQPDDKPHQNMTAAEQQSLLVKVLQNAPKYHEPTAAKSSSRKSAAGQPDAYLAALTTVLPAEEAINTAGAGRRLSATPVYFDVRPRFTGWSKCMDVQYSRVSQDGTTIWNWDCNLSIAQRFYLVLKFASGGQNYYEFRTTGGKCVDVRGGNGSIGSPLITYTCSGGGNQAFRLEAVSGFIGVYKIHPYTGQGCVDVQGARTWNGVIYAYWNCNGGDNQQFWLRSI